MEHKALFLDAGTYLIDSDFLTRDNPRGKAKYSNLFVTTQRPDLIDMQGDQQGDFYMKNFDNREFGAKGIRLVAVKFPMGGDLKFTEFQVYIFRYGFDFCLIWGIDSSAMFSNAKNVIFSDFIVPISPGLYELFISSHNQDI